MSTEALFHDFAVMAPQAKKHRLVAAVDGRDKHGKTHFALTAPGPILYQDFDMGTEGVADKFLSGGDVVERFKQTGKIIVKSRPYVIRPPEVLAGSDDAEKIAEQEWTRLHTSFCRGLKEPIVRVDGRPYKARTQIVDTGSEQWDLIRLKEFGKLVQVPSFKYREVNSIMRDMVRQALESDVNVLFLHKLEPEWTGPAEKRSKSGVWLRKGFDEMAHLVQVNMFAYRAPMAEASPIVWRYKVGLGEGDEWTADPRAAAGDLGFRVRIVNCRQKPELEGLTFGDDMATFSTFASMITGSGMEPWDDTVTSR